MSAAATLLDVLRSDTGGVSQAKASAVSPPAGNWASPVAPKAVVMSPPAGNWGTPPGVVGVVGVGAKPPPPVKAPPSKPVATVPSVTGAQAKNYAVLAAAMPTRPAPAVLTAQDLAQLNRLGPVMLGVTGPPSVASTAAIARPTPVVTGPLRVQCSHRGKDSSFQASELHAAKQGPCWTILKEPRHGAGISLHVEDQCASTFL